MDCMLCSEKKAEQMAARLLNSKTSMLFLCDMQEKFRQTVSHFPQIVEVSNRMLQTAKILDMPVVATEQYPKGLGRTVPELWGKLDPLPTHEKTCFSMVIDPVQQQLTKHPHVKTAILCGIEAHACIFQTAHDLLEKKYNVHLVVDACSSRNPTDRMYAFRQLEKAGAYLTTSECAILALLRDASHPKFKEIQKIIMTVAPDSDLLGKST